MSIDQLELEIKQRVGTEEEQWQAKRILPVGVRGCGCGCVGVGVDGGERERKE